MANLVLGKSEYLSNWYVIHVEEDGKLEYYLNGKAVVEGTDSEMLNIAEAIEGRRSIWFTRCAVRVDEDKQTFCFYNPKSSYRHEKDPPLEVVPFNVADALAKDIREKLKE